MSLFLIFLSFLLSKARCLPLAKYAPEELHPALLELDGVGDESVGSFGYANHKSTRLLRIFVAWVNNLDYVC